MQDRQAALLARIAAELAAQPDERTTRQRLVELAQEVIGCGVVALWRLADHGTVLEAATDRDEAERIARALKGLQSATGWQGLRSAGRLVVVDVHTDTRWPELSARARAEGLRFRSAVGYALEIKALEAGTRLIGALLLYDERPGYFTDELTELGGLLATHAAVALDGAHAADQAENLALALATNRVISMAMGVLMAQHRITADDAFDLLRRTSQHTHRKLHDIAEDVVLTGDLPEPD